MRARVCVCVFVCLCVCVYVCVCVCACACTLVISCTVGDPSTVACPLVYDDWEDKVPPAEFTDTTATGDNHTELMPCLTQLPPYKWYRWTATTNEYPLFVDNCNWATSGKRFYVLGGGNDGEDSLFRYKLSFAPRGARPLKVGKWVINRNLYEQLIAARRSYEKSKGVDWTPKPGYFPAYRAPSAN